MAQWMKTIAGSMCILTLLLHLVPDGRFAKYVRFYAGLVFFLFVIHPILALFGDADQLEQLLELEFLKEEYYDLESAAEGLSDLKNEQILAAYQEELERQVTEIASAYGLTAVTTELTFAGDGYSIDTVSMAVANPSGEDAQAAVEKAKNEITGLYLLPEGAVKITWNGQD